MTFQHNNATFVTIGSIDDFNFWKQKIVLAMSNYIHKFIVWLKCGCCMAFLISFGVHAQSASQVEPTTNASQESPNSQGEEKDWMKFNASLKGISPEERIRQVDQWLISENGFLTKALSASSVKAGAAGSLSILKIPATSEDSIIPSGQVLAVHLQDKGLAEKVREIDQILAEDKNYQEAQSKQIAARENLPARRVSLENEIREVDFELAKKTQSK